MKKLILKAVLCAQVSMVASLAVAGIGEDPCSSLGSSAYAPIMREACITDIYEDILYRRPDPSGLAYYTKLLDFASPAQIRRDIASSPEAAQVIAGYYRIDLGREPDPGGLAFWVNVLGRPEGDGILYVDRGFYESAEYKSKHP